MKCFICTWQFLWKHLVHPIGLIEDCRNLDSFSCHRYSHPFFFQISFFPANEKCIFLYLSINICLCATCIFDAKTDSKKSSDLFLVFLSPHYKLNLCHIRFGRPNFFVDFRFKLNLWIWNSLKTVVQMKFDMKLRSDISIPKALGNINCTENWNYFGAVTSRWNHESWHNFLLL